MTLGWPATLGLLARRRGGGTGGRGLRCTKVRNKAAAMKEVSDSWDNDDSHDQHGRRNEKNKQYVPR
jgi:hypothetical protein